MNTLNTRQLKISYPLIASVILHLTAFIAVGLYFDFSSTSPVLGNTTAPILNSYLFDDHFAQTITTTEKQQLTSNKKNLIAEKSSQKNNHALALQQNNTAATNQSSSIKHSKASHGEQTEELIALLHTAIQNQQHYPQSAIQMEREGRITLAFTLYTNGTISNLRVIKSSQTSSLDDAALAAVRDAAPFQTVKKYLKKPQEYSIDVVFELT